MAMTAFALTGCTDSDEGIIPEEIPFVPPTAEAFAGLRAVAMENRLQTTSFNAEDGVFFTSEKGVLLTISGGCIMDANGDPVPEKYNSIIWKSSKKKYDGHQQTYHGRNPGR